MPTEARKPCPTCGAQFRLRSLREHLQSSHLGTFCFFPGSDAKLEREDDAKMTEVLVRANEQLQIKEEMREKEEGKAKGEFFYCRWKGCKQGEGHKYDRLTSLKRHLRTKQREEYTRYLTEASRGYVPSVAPQATLAQDHAVQAWDTLHVPLSMVEAKLQCVEILVTPLAPPDGAIGPGRLQRILGDIIQTDMLVDAAIPYVESVTRGPKTGDCWDQFAQAREEWHRQLATWACNAVDMDTDHLYEWACLNVAFGKMTHVIEQIKAA